MTDKQKILQYLDNKGISKNRFYVKTGLSTGFLDKGSSLGLDKLKIIIDNYPDLSVEWLLHDKGPMILNDDKKHEAVPLTAGHVKYIPLVSQYAQAGYLSGFADETYMETLPTIPVILTQEAKGDYVCFEVSGDSMISDSTPAESIFEGDLLVCRNVDRCYWTSKLHINKWDFVIVHKEEGVIVKRITDHQVENGNITIHSLNTMYDNRIINLQEVDKLFNVVKVIRERKR